MDILEEEVDQFVPFLLLILDEPGGGPLTEELHQAALHHQPEASGHVEDNSQEYEVKWNPLVVRIVDNRVIAVILEIEEKLECKWW